MYSNTTGIIDPNDTSNPEMDDVVYYPIKFD